MSHSHDFNVRYSIHIVCHHAAGLHNEYYTLSREQSHVKAWLPWELTPRFSREQKGLMVMEDGSLREEVHVELRVLTAYM